MSSRATSVACALAIAWGIPAAAETVDGNIVVCVGRGATPAVRAAAERLVADARTVPVLKALFQTQRAATIELDESEALLEKKRFWRAAGNHIVAIGLKGTDPLVAATWGHYASVDEGARTVYMQGYGHLRGDIGCVESDRNPFLYSQNVKTADRTTCLFRISGTTEAGVLAGVEAFRGGLLNGLVAAGELSRPKRTILDLDPSMAEPPVDLPGSVTLRRGTAPLAGWTQAWGEEYRVWIDNGGVEPAGVWRFKYLEPAALDAVDLRAWNAAFHRRSFGNAVTIVEFATEDQARAAAAAAAARDGFAKIELAGTVAWVGTVPDDMTTKEDADKVYIAWRGTAVVMSSLAKDATEAVLRGLAPNADRRAR